MPVVAACTSIAIPTKSNHIIEKAADSEPLETDFIHVIGASHHDNGWNTKSIVYRFDETSEELVELQRLETKARRT